MAREFSRSRRVGEQIQRELSELLRREIRDPRANLATVMDVEVSRDLAYAKVFVSSMDAAVDHEELLAVLNRAAGFLRHEIGRGMKLRVVPQLRFYFDDSIEYGARMDAVIAEARRHDGHGEEE